MDPAFLGLRHVALNVQNVQKSVDFYTKVLGMTIEWNPDPDNFYLTSGSDNLAIHKSHEAGSPGVQRIDHIGFVVRSPESVDWWADRLKSLGIPFVHEPKDHRDGARSFYFNDPDGLLIQLIYHPPIANKS